MESATLEGTEPRPPWSDASTPSAILAASVGFKELRSIGAMPCSQARWGAVRVDIGGLESAIQIVRAQQRQMLLPNVRYWPKADIGLCTAHVCFRGQSGHDAINVRYAQSGHMG